jgi:hypothetical protein
VSKKLLDRADVGAGLDEVRGEAMAERVRSRRFVNARAAGGSLDGPLEETFVDMMSPDDARARIG